MMRIDLLQVDEYILVLFEIGNKLGISTFDKVAGNVKQF